MNSIISDIIFQLDSESSQSIHIPKNYEDQFWNWFDTKSNFFYKKKIIKNLINPRIPVSSNFCYKNSYRIAKGFVKHFYYYEGFVYYKEKDFYYQHAFNVKKNRRVSDFTLQKTDPKEIGLYIGVKIPLSFIRNLYEKKGDWKNTQYSLLIPYFMHKTGIPGFLEYASPD